MDILLKRYDRYKMAVKLTLPFVQAWQKRKDSRVYLIFTYIYGISSVLTCIGIGIFMMDYITNINFLTRAMSVQISLMTVIIKLVIFAYYQSTLCELHDALETGFRKDFDNPELQPVLLSTFNFFYKPTLWLIAVTWILVLIYDSTPIISIILQRVHNVVPIVYRTPYPTKFFWSYENSMVLYLLQFGNDACTSIGIGYVTSGTDALFGFYIFQMASQFRTIAYRMKNLKSSDDYRTVIKECHERSLILENCRNQLQDVYGPIVLWMFTTSALNMCANIFQASQTSIHKQSKVAVYMITKLLQTLLYGWYGLFLTMESEGFRYSVYSCGWNGCGDKTFMTNILTMAAYKPLVLKACQMFVISLDMFVAIVNTAISYFFLLRTLDEK